MLKTLFNAPFPRLVLRMCLLLAAVLLACRLFGLYALMTLLLLALHCALTGKSGWAILGLTLITIISTSNPLVIPRPPYFSIISRIGSVALACGIVLGAMQRKGDERPPLGLLLLYLVCAFVSSTQGYCPLVSYLKIVNFAVFFIGIAAGVSNIGKCHGDIIILRAGFIAVGVMYVWGSLATLPFPAVAYLTSLANKISAEGVEAASAAFVESGGNGLFAGITCQSQVLGPCLGCVFGLVACDMLIIERKVSPIHLLIILPIPFLLAMTKSRIGLVTFLTALVFLSAWLIPRIRISPEGRQKIKKLATMFTCLIITMSCVAEVRHSTVSRLLRKTGNVAYDERTLVEAFTSSRMGKISECMRDFRKNPLWGKGFQVDETFEERFKGRRGLVFSASIEKGVMPAMVLGETGIIGGIVFLAFLLSFYNTCFKRKYFTTMLLFSVMLASNMGEATFFSPSGAGGVFWLICVAGGFAIDMAKKNSDANPPVAVGVLPLNPFRRTRIPLEAFAP